MQRQAPNQMLRRLPDCILDGTLTSYMQIPSGYCTESMVVESSSARWIPASIQIIHLFFRNGRGGGGSMQSMGDYLRTTTLVMEPIRPELLWVAMDPGLIPMISASPTVQDSSPPKCLPVATRQSHRLSVQPNGCSIRTAMRRPMIFLTSLITAGFRIHAARPGSWMRRRRGG